MDELLKGNKEQTDNRLSEPIDRFVKMQNDEQWNKIEMEERYRVKGDTANRKYGCRM